MGKILITGGAGYIGSHVNHLLTQSGFNCIVYDNLSRGHQASVKNTPLIVGDVRDREKLASLFQTHQFDAIIHLAALAYVGESVFEPMLYWDNNFIGTKTLLEEAIKSGIGNIVFSSTCAVYGEPDLLPISEKNPIKPINPYGQSKYACEQLMDNLDDLGLIKSVRFRYFNAAGADYQNQLGELHEPETHLIPLLIDYALGKRKEFKVFGSDYPTQDGSAVRDYIHVSDLAIAHKLGLEYLLQGGKTQAVNLGTGQGQSVFQIIERAERLIGKKLTYAIEKRRPGDPAELIADPARAKELLNWQASKDIEVMLSDAIAWHRGLTL
jgi:UDP-glucose 4-epimerase